VLEATVAGGADPARLGDYFRSWPLPFASRAEAFLGQDALSRSWTGHLEPSADGGLVPPFDADVMQAVMEGVTAPRWRNGSPSLILRAAGAPGTGPIRSRRSLRAAGGLQTEGQGMGQLVAKTTVDADGDLAFAGDVPMNGMRKRPPMERVARACRVSLTELTRRSRFSSAAETLASLIAFLRRGGIVLN
jgi:hypothetical protein